MNNPLYGIGQPQQAPTQPVGGQLPQQNPQAALTQQPGGALPQQNPQAAQGSALWRELAKIVMGGE